MTMNQQPIRILFLCTHNSARSILAEAVLNHLGHGRFEAHSAGSSPRENQQPHPMALQVLQGASIRTEGLRSKSWDEFEKPGAVPMDLVITVCDNAANEVCPLLPGHPATAHWGYADPSATEGTSEHKLEAFRQTLHALHNRIELLVNLSESGLDRLTLQDHVRKLAAS